MPWFDKLVKWCNPMNWGQFDWSRLNIFKIGLPPVLKRLDRNRPTGGLTRHAADPEVRWAISERMTSISHASLRVLASRNWQLTSLHLYREGSRMTTFTCSCAFRSV